MANSVHAPPWTHLFVTCPSSTTVVEAKSGRWEWLGNFSPATETLTEVKAESFYHQW